MITAQTFPKMELTENMAKLLFHSIIAETHSLCDQQIIIIYRYTPHPQIHR